MFNGVVKNEKTFGFHQLDNDPLRGKATQYTCSKQRCGDTASRCPAAREVG